VNLKEMLGPWPEPPAILVTGPSGSGKTVDDMKCFPTHMRSAQLPGGTRGWIRVLGLPVEQLKTQNLKDLDHGRQYIAFLRQRNQEVMAGKRPPTDLVVSLIVDDLSLLAQAQFRKLRGAIERSNNFQFFEELRISIQQFAADCRNAGLFLVANAHLSPPGTMSDGQWYPGGPSMPIAKLIPVAPHIFDTSIYVGSSIEERKPWGNVYYNYGPGGDYVSKDRHHVVRNPSPMNLRELLTSVGYKLPRAPGLDWQDRVAEEVAGRLQAGANFLTLWDGRMAKLKEKSATPQHVLHWRWALEDGRDRFEIRQANEAALYAL